MVGQAQPLEAAGILIREWEPPKPLGLRRTVGRLVLR